MSNEEEIRYKLLNSFKGSFFNHAGEFIAIPKTNDFFMFKSNSEETEHNCNSELGVKCKVLEWLSRPAYKTSYDLSKNIQNELSRLVEDEDDWWNGDSNYNIAYRAAQKKRDDFMHNKVRNQINDYLGTDFTHEDMEKIYTPLGNCCNHELTIKFVESGYNMKVLERRGE